jgi:hypothetical protein
MLSVCWEEFLQFQNLGQLLIISPGLLVLSSYPNKIANRLHIIPVLVI